MINIQNTDDNECFKWCLVRCVNPTDHNPRKITKIDKDLTKRFDLKNVTFSVKIRDVHKIEKKKKKKKNKKKKKKKKKKRIPLALVFLVMKIKKTYNLCIKVIFFRKTS